MYRLLLLLAAASAVRANSPCNRALWDHAKNMFTSLSTNVINHDHDMSETCKHFTNYKSIEIFGDNAFKIVAQLPGFDNAVWNVKIRHRVIYINGHFPRAGNDCDLTFVDIRVLPKFANTHAAAWTYSNGAFTVAFPFKYSLQSHQLACSQDIDATLIDVRRGLPNERIFM